MSFDELNDEPDVFQAVEKLTRQDPSTTLGFLSGIPF
jgi:hypothetical protein